MEIEGLKWKCGTLGFLFQKDDEEVLTLKDRKTEDQWRLKLLS